MFRKNKLLSEAEISSFCQQINMIIKAGLPTYYGISILRDETMEKDMRELLTAIYEPIEQGAYLYDALLQTGVFPDYMLHMIKIGEGIKQAVTYPIIMSVMMLAIIVVIITKVVPIFSDVYAELGSGLDTDQGLSLAESLVDNRHMEENIRKCKEYISQGENFAKALLLSGCFSEMYSSMIVIGYKTSAMDDVMLRVSKAYEKEADEKLPQFISLLEPSLIIVLCPFPRESPECYPHS